MTEEKEAKKDTESLKAGKENKNKKKLKSVSSKADKKKDTPDDSLDQLKSEKEAAEQEAKETYDKLLRVSAEFDNYKKRTAREMDEFRKFANESLLRKLLPVVDNLERAISSLQEKESSESGITEGIEMTLKEILNILETFQVKPIESLHKTFDPNFHQAVMQEETDEIEENTIIKEFQKGYTIQNRLLRAAMVVVAKAKTDKSDNS
jgi:molecular chaperone GrpE